MRALLLSGMELPRIVPRFRTVEDIVRKLDSVNPRFVVDTSIIIPGAFAVIQEKHYSIDLPADFLPGHQEFIDYLLDSYECYFVPSQQKEIFPPKKKQRFRHRQAPRKTMPNYKYKTSSFKKISRSKFKEHQIKVSAPGALAEEGSLDMDNPFYLRARNALRSVDHSTLSRVDRDLSALTVYCNLVHEQNTYLLSFDTDLCRSTNAAWRHLRENGLAESLGRKVRRRPAPNLYRFVCDL